MMGVEQGELLLVIGPALDVVDMQHDPPAYSRDAISRQLRARNLETRLAACPNADDRSRNNAIAIGLAPWRIARKSKGMARQAEPSR